MSITVSNLEQSPTIVKRIVRQYEIDMSIKSDFSTLGNFTLEFAHRGMCQEN